MTEVDTETLREVSCWLKQWQGCIRERSYSRARPLFDEDIFSFGTASPVIRGLNDLANHQWRVVWEKSEDFDFDFTSLIATRSQDSSLVLLAIEWQSVGICAKTANRYFRNGRASIALKKAASSSWIGVHTHFSIHPKPELLNAI